MSFDTKRIFKFNQNKYLQIISLYQLKNINLIAIKYSLSLNMFYKFDYCFFNWKHLTIDDAKHNLIVIGTMLNLLASKVIFCSSE